MAGLTQLDEIGENCFDPGRMQNISGGSLLRKILDVTCRAYSPKICTLQFLYGIRKLCIISSYQLTPDQTTNVVAETHGPTDLLGSLEQLGCWLRMLA